MFSLGKPATHQRQKVSTQTLVKMYQDIPTQAMEGYKTAPSNVNIDFETKPSSNCHKQTTTMSKRSGSATQKAHPSDSITSNTNSFRPAIQNSDIHATINGLKRKRATENETIDPDFAVQDSEIHETLHQLKRKRMTEKASALPASDSHHLGSGTFISPSVSREASGPLRILPSSAAHSSADPPTNKGPEFSRPPATWTQLIIQAFEDLELKPLTARQVQDQIQLKHPWFQNNPKNIKINAMKRSISASLSNKKIFAQRTASGLDGCDSQSHTCYIYVPKGMSEDEVINKTRISDPEWWQETFEKTNQHKLKEEGAVSYDSVLYDSEYAVVNNIREWYQVKPQNSQSEPWTNLKSYKRIKYEKNIYTVGDIVRLGIPNQFTEYCWIREIRVRQDGQPAFLMFWFYFKDFLSSVRSRALNPEIWPADKDYLLSNCVNVFSPVALAGKPDKDQLQRIDLNSKIITFLSRSSKLKDMDSDDVSWMFENGRHPSKFKAAHKGASKATQREMEDLPAFYTPDKKYRHPLLFDPSQSPSVSEGVELDGSSNLPSLTPPASNVPSKRKNPMPDLSDEANIAPAAPPESHRVDLQVTPKRKRHLSDVIQEVAETPVSPPSKRPRTEEKYVSVQDILERRPEFYGWDSLQFDVLPEKQKRKPARLPNDDTNSQTETPHESFIRYIYDMPPLHNFVRCVHRGLLAYRNKLDVSVKTTP